MSFIVDYEDDVTDCSLTVDEDECVAYAYLLCGEKVVGDVWLYNRGPTPEHPEWRDPSKMPFANPKGYAKDEYDIRTIDNEDDLYVEWIHENKELSSVKIWIDETLLAILQKGAKPGWCVNAQKDGPLAKCLPVDDSTKLIS